MYAVINTGGKQYRVAEGERVDVELLGETDDKVELAPVLIVDGDRVVSATKDLAKVKVKATIVGEAKGSKITGFTYKNKTNSSKRWGHRQHYSTIEITGITGVPKG
jgi:large subunit ribosomal protein L21